MKNFRITLFFILILSIVGCEYPESDVRRWQIDERLEWVESLDHTRLYIVFRSIDDMELVIHNTHNQKELEFFAYSVGKELSDFDEPFYTLRGIPTKFRFDYEHIQFTDTDSFYRWKSDYIKWLKRLR